jgi:hypothetical protein
MTTPLDDLSRLFRRWSREHKAGPPAAWARTNAQIKADRERYAQIRERRERETTNI